MMRKRNRLGRSCLGLSNYESKQGKDKRQYQRTVSQACTSGDEVTAETVGGQHFPKESMFVSRGKTCESLNWEEILLGVLIPVTCPRKTQPGKTGVLS